MFGFGRQPERVVKKSIDQSRERQEQRTGQSNNNYDDGMPYESILDDSEHKREVADYKLQQARATYESTRQPEHWQHLQKCITEYQKANQ